MGLRLDREKKFICGSFVENNLIIKCSQRLLLEVSQLNTIWKDPKGGLLFGKLIMFIYTVYPALHFIVTQRLA